VVGAYQVRRSGGDWLRVRLRCQGGLAVGTVVDPRDDRVLAHLEAGEGPSGPAGPLLPYGVIARDEEAAFDDFCVRTSAKWVSQ